MTGSDGKTLKEAGTAQPVRVIGFKGTYVNLLHVEDQRDGLVMLFGMMVMVPTHYTAPARHGSLGAC